MGDQQPVSAVILAGGRSRRLGSDKRALRLWGAAGPTLLEHTIATVGALCDEVVVVLNDPERWPGLRARVVPDRYPEGGALGGIFSGLASCAAPYALVVACDMPLLSPRLLAAMIALPRDYDVLVPRAASPAATRSRLGLEPLHAIYGHGCLGPMRAALEAGRRQIVALFPQLRVRVLDHAELAAHDPEGVSCLNINTPEQLAEALRRIGAGDEGRAP